MQLVGNSQDKRLVKVIFGSPDEFNVEITRHKNQKHFFFKKHLTVVSWDEDMGRYEFYCN